MICWLLDEKMPVWEEDPPAFLNPAEAAELAGKRFPKRRADWLHGRWAAKKLLQKRHPACAEVSLSEIVIANEPGRAPYALLANGADVIPLPGCLSISHSGPMAASALALAPHLRVGIDLEKIEARPAGFFEAYFTPHENAYLRSLPPESAPEILTLWWSAKESVLKALRTGLAQDTMRVEIDLTEGNSEPTHGWRHFGIAGEAVAASTAGPKPWTWSGWWQVNQNYILTLAAAGPAEALRQGPGREIPLEAG
jgi:4'-phosphopantetheinyl transferase